MKFPPMDADLARGAQRRARLLLCAWLFAAVLLAACSSRGTTGQPVAETAGLLPSATTSPASAPAQIQLSPTIEASASTTAASPRATLPVTAATLTPWPTNTLAFPPSVTPAAGTPWPACPGSRASRLRVGAYATVSEDPPQANNVRDAAGVDRLKIGQIQPGARVEIIAGPACVGGWTWWKIQSEASGLTGWTAEGDAENYWLVPEG